ncbi:ferredoxin--NADP reductase [Streptomyces luteolus]|uniref:Ferredoxin--NADP reductase n=1 Tax=Streptomyces luteolus TaxID=3043615 RepID=A0ABT6T2T2_9ACTN|nr:ferredoxin--NADP reductase [Streptomyces sp. B-S-A12]MDI3422178.1 ferredoxin--NADP reductase [Streptomyces sp. B-S-A12]
MTSRTPLTVRVVKVVKETADAHSLVLEPADGSADKFRYKPGQFLTVRVPSEREGGSVARCYSLCSSPMRDDHLKVTVKRTADGYGSNWICDRVTEGDVLEVLRPAGTFTPDSLDEDLLLCAAGSGITPVMSILSSCLHAGTGSVTLLYANRDEQSVIFRDELAALCREYGERLTIVHWLESVQGLPTRTAIQALTRPYAGHRAFVCGPGPFMELTTEALTRVGLPADRMTLERFTSLTSDPFTAPESAPEPEGESGGPAGTVEVELDGDTRSLAWPRESRLLDVLLAAGLDAPYSCREGNCSACACVVVEGEAAMARNEVLDAADLADGLLLACQALPVSDRLRITYDG